MHDAFLCLYVQWQVDVNGPNTAPIYKFLKSSAGGFLGDLVKWNFEKFLVDKTGKVVERYPPTTSPFQIEVNFVSAFIITPLLYCIRLVCQIEFSKYIFFCTTLKINEIIHIYQYVL